jgi:hypothetical protein
MSGQKSGVPGSTSISMILFIDTYISETALAPNKRLEELLGRVQSNAYAYRKKPKIDIFKYSLASYACIKWSKIVIRVDGDDRNAIGELLAYARDLFPDVCIEMTRSDSGMKYAEALEKLGPGDPWVFFSPNNDHPFIHHDTEVFESLVQAAESAEEAYGYPVSILFSHFTESINSVYPDQYLYRYTGESCQVLSENNTSYTVLYPHLSLLSLQIYRRNYLKRLMLAAGGARVIRTECLGKYNDYNLPSVVIIPKVECCRHYDAYMHTSFVVKDYITATKVPPLFIPDGFFEKSIKIRYGFDEYNKGWVNINPRKRNYIFDSPNGTDMAISLDQLPAFWLSRIAAIEVNPKFQDVTRVEDAPLPQDIMNPWRSMSKIDLRLIATYRRIFYSKPIAALRKIFRHGLISGHSIIRSMTS